MPSRKLLWHDLEASETLVPDKKFVYYQRVRMIEGWPERIPAAQLEKTVVINGAEHNRVRYGEEEDHWGGNRGPCHDVPY